MRVYIGLGSNLDDRRAYLRSAVDALQAIPQLILRGRSSLYFTAPMGAADKAFVNAVIELDSDHEPLELMQILLKIELAHGRTRELHWGNRTLDLDLLLALDGGLPLEGSWGSAQLALQLPHPRIAERDFVLAPLAELAPNLRIGHHSAQEHLDRIDDNQRTVLRMESSWNEPASK